MSDLPVGRIEKLSDGGPAFPPQDRVLVTSAATVEQMKHIAETLKHAQQTGMTLRDYFAAAALSGLIHHYQSDEAISSDPLPDLSRTAYDYADAMLKAREACP